MRIICHHAFRVLLLVFAAGLAPSRGQAPADAESARQRTYCNPLPLPDYPIGRLSRDVRGEIAGPDENHWLLGRKEQFRELADPTVIWHDGRWYLYPSCDMAWVSENGVTWTHHRLNLRDIGYAPTVVRSGSRFLLTASGAAIYASESPLGPFNELGRVKTPQGKEPQSWQDPMLLADDDERLYLYWGIAAPGIFGAELDAADPTRMKTAPRILIKHDPAHAWEAHGEWNEDPSTCWLEGSWVLKRGGHYYLTYAAPGTEFRTYAMGCYRSDSPLGLFTYQQRNPILRTTHGLVNGPGHGCIVAGPGKTLWAFYTCRLCYTHIFERRIGMDPAGFDAEGNLFVSGASQVPQLAPGIRPRPADGNDAGWLPLNIGKVTRSSSAATGRPGIYAVDEEMRTWWQPDDDDTRPVLESRLGNRFRIRAVRLIWRDVGLETSRGIVPGPFAYRVEVQDGTQAAWKAVVDRTASHDDLAIDYREFGPASGTAARLVITGWPKGIKPGVIEFTVFGDHDPGSSP